MGFAIRAADEGKSMMNMQHLIEHIHRSDLAISVADVITTDVLSVAASRGFNRVVEFCCRVKHHTRISKDSLFVALCAASYTGHRRTCKLLLEYGAPINSPMWYAEPTPLHFAAVADHGAVTKLLCEHGADVNAQFNSGGCDGGRIYMWNRVVTERSIGKRMQDMINRNSLHINPLGAAIIGLARKIPSSFSTLILLGGKLPVWAVYASALQPPKPWIAHFAVEQGASLNWRGADGATALQTALRGRCPMTPNETSQIGSSHSSNSYLEIVSLLVNAGAETVGSESELVVLLEDWRPPDESLPRDFLDAFTCTSPKLSTLAATFLTRSIPKIQRALTTRPVAYEPGALCAGVMFAISNGSAGFLQQILNNRPVVVHDSCQEGTALGLAAWYGRMDIVDMLLSKVPNATPALIPVHLETHQPELRIPPTPWRKDMQTIISESFEDSIPIWHREPQVGMELLCGTPLTLSIWSQTCLDKLLEKDFYPDRLTIAVAVCHGDIKILERLLQRKRIDDSHTDRPGPVYLSVERMFEEMTRILLDAGLSPNEPNNLVKFGRSPLQKAVEDGNLKMIDLLLDSGADVNAVAAKYCGGTALQLAAITGRLGIARRLVDLGADIDAPSAQIHGRTALEGAAELGRLDMVQFLLHCGANIIGYGSLQYFKAIRFAQEQGHKVVENSLSNHREWTSFEHESWLLFNALDNEGRQKLTSLEELYPSSDECPSFGHLNGAIPEEMVLQNESSDYEFNNGQEQIFGEGRTSPEEAAHVGGSSGRFRTSWAAMSVVTGYDSGIASDPMASHICYDTTWSRQIDNLMAGFQSSWEDKPMEVVHGNHVMQGFQIPDINSQVKWNQQFMSENQGLQAGWGYVGSGGLEDDVKMEEQPFFAVSVESAGDQQLGATDWTGTENWPGAEMQSRIAMKYWTEKWIESIHNEL